MVYPKSGGQAYWLHGKLHRIDGPAVMDMGSETPNRWYVFGRKLEYQALLRDIMTA
jgi:hypothetical protein